MAQVIVEVYRGIIDGLHSNSMEDLHVRIFDSDDQNDPERGHLFAACDYAINHGGLTDHMNQPESEGVHLLEEPLICTPDVLRLITEDNQMCADAGGNKQQQAAAFAAGYLQAIGELNAFLRVQTTQNSEQGHNVFRILSRFIDRQYGRFFDFCEDINTPSRYGPSYTVNASEKIGDQKKLFHLVVQDDGADHTPGADVWVMAFECAYNNSQEAEQAARHAVASFLRTAEGKDILDGTNGCFNWGDVMAHVPDSFYIGEELQPIKATAIESWVSHDEDLTAEE